MKVMKYFAVASLALFAACNNEENLVVPEGANQPVDVMMSVALPGPGTRAAMGDLQNTANNGDPATVEKLHVYLLKGDDIVFAKEFTKGSDDFTKLTSSTAVGAGEATGGYKFLNVDKGATKALVIANPQGALVENKPVSDVSKQLLKAKINEVIYAGSKELTTVGAESYGVDPQQDKRTVKKAELTLAASMNRFQVTGTKFIKVTWKDGKKAEAEQWCKTWLGKAENNGKTSADAWTAFKAAADGFNNEVWDGKSDLSKKAALSKWLQVVDVTSANQGILMNRFSRTLSIPALTVEEEANWFWAKTYAGDRYDFTNGTFKPDGKTDLSDVSSYFTATAFDFGAGKKAAAFNFFSNGITGYGKTNNAPKLAFVFKTGDAGVSVDRRFVVISGYAKTEGATDGTTDVPAGKGGYLINLNLSTLNNGQGILVDTDPTIPEGVMRYINIFLPVAVFSNYVAIFIRADNDPNRAMAGVLLGGVVNIALDIIFVFPMHMGMGGAAFASVLGMTIQVIVGGSHFFSRKNGLHFIRPIHTIPSIRHIIVGGIPSFFNEFANGFIVLLFNIQILKYCGENALSIYSVISNCVILFNSLFTGVGQSIQPVISTNYGAGNGVRIKGIKKMAYTTILIMGAIFSLSGILFPTAVCRIFIKMNPTLTDIRSHLV